MSLEEIKEFLRKHPGYSKEGSNRLARKLNSNENLCYQALGEIRKEFKNKHNEGSINIRVALDHEFKSSQDVFKNSFFDVSRGFNYEKKAIEIFKKTLEVKKNVLVIGDLHLPFTLDGYLEHCIETYYKHNCNEVVFIGDIIDNHASSYHETDPDGYSAGQELKLAIQQVKKWYQAFPKATVIIGNHDRLIMRKAYSSGLSKLWIKDYAEVLGAPGWNFTESIEIDDVLYIHGEGGVARTRARRDLCSIVQGHLHTQASVDWIVGKNFKIFACQTGCGIDAKAYAMVYAKEFAKPAIGCAVILNGKTVFNEMMDL